MMKSESVKAPQKQTRLKRKKSPTKSHKPYDLSKPPKKEDQRESLRPKAKLIRRKIINKEESRGKKGSNQQKFRVKVMASQTPR